MLAKKQWRELARIQLERLWGNLLKKSEVLERRLVSILLLQVVVNDDSKGRACEKTRKLGSWWGELGVEWDIIQKKSRQKALLIFTSPSPTRRQVTLYKEQKLCVNRINAVPNKRVSKKDNDMMVKEAREEKRREGCRLGFQNWINKVQVLNVYQESLWRYWKTFSSHLRQSWTLSTLK